MEVSTQVTTKKVDEAIARLLDNIISPALKDTFNALSCLGPVFKIIHRQLNLYDFKHNDYAQQSMEEFVLRVNSFPKQNKIDVIPEIGCKILPELPLISSEEIRGLYIVLLSKAANKDTVHEVHPRFIWIISQLCQEEINILRFVSQEKSQNIPYSKYHFIPVSSQNGEYLTNKKRFFHPTHIKLAGDKNIDFLLENLHSLGIIENIEDQWSEDLDDNFYLEIKKYSENISEYIKLKSSDKVRNIEPTIQKNIYSISEFGRLFLSATDIIK